MNTPIKPHITEKSYQATEQATGAVYTFKVATALSKSEVKKLVEREYKVSVLSVNMVRMEGKVRRFKGIPGKTDAFKKALVRVKKGDRIKAFDIETKEAEPKE